MTTALYMYNVNYIAYSEEFTIIVMMNHFLLSIAIAKVMGEGGGGVQIKKYNYKHGLTSISILVATRSR